MTFGPIERRLRDHTGDDADLTHRAGHLLRTLAEPVPLSDRARFRALAALREVGPGSYLGRFGTLRPAVFLAMLVFSVAASATRGWWHVTPPPSTPAPVLRAPEPKNVAPPAPPKVLRLPPVKPAEAPAPVLVPVKKPTRPKLVIPAPVATAEIPAPIAPILVKPRLLSNPQAGPRPTVPFNVARSGAKFSVLLEICVSEAGDVGRASVLDSEYPMLDARILEHVRSWKYAPAEADGRPVPLCFPLRYRLSMATETNG